MLGKGRNKGHLSESLVMTNEGKHESISLGNKLKEALVKMKDVERVLHGFDDLSDFQVTDYTIVPKQGVYDMLLTIECFSDLLLGTV